jgi:tetratricopeptide (TPR) repeat protein
VKEFADAVGVDQRSVRNWKRDRNLPSDIATIERVLFRNTPHFDAWCLELRAAHGKRDSTAARNRARAARSARPRDGLLPPFLGVPPRIASFTGRLETLDQLHLILARGKFAAVIQAIGRAAVQGIGGVGKSSLAIEYAYRYRARYAGVYWCSAETRTGLLSSLAKLAETLGAAPPGQTDVVSSAQLALRWLSEQRTTWLLIYDNVTSPDEIKDLLPASGARILITSRFPDWRGWAEELQLDVLSFEEAILFLQERVNRKDDVGARALAEALGCLPLALDHAAAICRMTQTAFTDYATKIAHFIDTAPRGVACPLSVSATFHIAIARAATQSAMAEWLMSYLAQCGPERIPMTLLEGAIDDHEARASALLALTQVSLVKHDPFSDGTPAVTVHRLVQAVARARSETKGDAIEATAKLISRLDTIYPDGFSNPAAAPLCSNLTPHIPAQIDRGTSNLDVRIQWANVLDRAGTYLHGRAVYDRAEALIRQALSIRESVLGHLNVQTASSLNNLALLLKDQGDLTSPHVMLERALAIREGALEAKHPHIAESLVNLAALLRDQGDLTAARPLFERALEIHETAAVLSQFGRLLYLLGDFFGAQTLHERALAIREKRIGPEHPFTASSLNYLGLSLEAQGKLTEATALYRRALTIREKARGLEHPVTLRTIEDLARALEAQGEFEEARSLVERILHGLEKLYGAEHPSTHKPRESLKRLRPPARGQSLS